MLLKVAGRKALAILLFTAASPVFSQGYPVKPIRIVVPFTAGSASDILARFIGPKLYETWGQQVVVDNRSSAGGTVAGSVHAPRGMLEFWVDPASKYHKHMWADESKEFILFCGLGWRSALTAKTLQDMGMTNVAHIEGGWDAWVNDGGAVETLEERKAKKA